MTNYMIEEAGEACNCIQSIVTVIKQNHSSPQTTSRFLNYNLFFRICCTNYIIFHHSSAFNTCFARV